MLTSFDFKNLFYMFKVTLTKINICCTCHFYYWVMLDKALTNVNKYNFTVKCYQGKLYCTHFVGLFFLKHKKILWCFSICLKDLI